MILINKQYVVYHLHDDTSNCNGYADSCTKYEEYIKLAKKNNMTAIAFSNHGGIYDWVKKKQSCDKAKIKYIHGVELYIVNDLKDDYRGGHIGLYSKNWDGVKELNTLMSISTSKGVKEDNSDRHAYYNPRITFDELFDTSDNIIITSACLASPLWRLYSNYETEEEKIQNHKQLDKILKWFSKNNHRCFLEIQYHNSQHQIEYNKLLYQWSQKYNIPLIAGTDTHSSTPYKAECRKILQIAKDSFYGEEDEFDLTWKTYDELVQCFKIQNTLPEEVYLQAIENTNLLESMVENFELDKTYKYPTLYGNNASEQWKQLIYKKLKEKIENNAIVTSEKIIKQYNEFLEAGLPLSQNPIDEKTYQKALKYTDNDWINDYKKAIKIEFSAMDKQGMASFMIFMSELMTWCRENDIYSSPCRGSVGGSLIAYITDITDVDPMVWDTVFSRFCNADRVSLADIDADFSPDDREKVYQYIINRFGNKNVAYILTLGTVQDRGSIDVLAKGLGYKDLDKVKEIKNQFDDIFDKYSKIIQEEVNLEELEDATSKSPNFDDYELYINVIRNKKNLSKVVDLKKDWDKLRNDNKDLFYYFDGIKGTIISKGNHPAGMIGSPITLSDNLGVFYRKGDENFPVSFCSMKAVDSLNFVKFDILGLKTIGVLQDTYRFINKKWEFAHEINWNNFKVWNDMIRCNAGVFQFEGNFAGDLLSNFEPTTINHMSLVNASLRPSGKSYRDRLIAHEFNKNPSEEIDELLKDNNGFLVFQEDTIKFLTDICDFSGSEADSTRRAIGKKDIEELKKQLPKILEGYCKHSKKPKKIAEKEAKEFIQIISDSSEYQFGLNHSTGYSMNGYMCAKLRAYYPIEYITSYFNWAENEIDILNGMKLLNEYKITLNSPKFRYSKGKYFFNKETNTIYKGIGSIKDLNVSVGDELYQLRNNEYHSFLNLYNDMVKNTSINKGQIENLIILDYFEEFGKAKKLLDIANIYNLLCDRKQFNKADLIEEKYKQIGLTEDLFNKYSNKITEKLYKEIDFDSIMETLISKIEDIDIPLKEKLKFELDKLGYINTILPNLKEDLYFITDMQVFKNKKSNTYYPTLYNIKTGDISKYKIKDYVLYSENPFKQHDIIRIINQELEPKKKLVDGKWIKTDEFNKLINYWEVY